MSAAGLVEFIRARLDEDEAVAKAADVKQGDPEWFVSPVMATGGEHFTVRSKEDSRPIARMQRLDGDDDEPGGILDGAAVAEHIARHDPACVLAEVDAKRKLIEQHVGYYGSGDDEYWPVQVLRLLALPYANHPDYREEWRP